MAWDLQFGLDDRTVIGRSTGLAGQTETLTIENFSAGYQGTVGALLIVGVWAILATSATAGNRRFQVKLRSAPVTLFHFLGTNAMINNSTSRIEAATNMTQAAAQSGVVREAWPAFLHLPIAVISYELQWSVDNVQAGDVLSEVGFRGQIVPRSPPI